MIISQWGHALLILHLVRCTPASIVVHFKGGDGSILGDKEYNMGSTIFRVSERLKTALAEQGGETDMQKSKWRLYQGYLT